MLWALAKLRHYDGVLLTWLGKAVAEQLQHNEHAFSATQLQNVLWSYCQLAHVDAHVASAVTRALGAVL